MAEPRKVIWHKHTKVSVMISVCDAKSIDRILEWGYRVKILEELDMATLSFIKLAIPLSSPHMH